MLNDIRVGLRLLWKEKTFTLASGATLAICIGANVALFSIVDHVLLRPSAAVRRRCLRSGFEKGSYSSA